jgi:hypothetical protein
MDFRPEDVAGTVVCPVCGARLDGQPTAPTPGILTKPLPARWDKRIKLGIGAFLAALLFFGWTVNNTLHPPKTITEDTLQHAADAVKTLPGVQAVVVAAIDPPRLTVYAEDQGKKPEMYQKFLCAKIAQAGAWASVEVLPVGAGTALWNGVCR